MISDNHSQFSDIMLKVWYKQGDIAEKDCSCDSDYTSTVIIRAGQAIHEKIIVFQDTRKYTYL